MTNDFAPVPILLVDDLEENLLSLEALLRRDGLVFLRARSGREALELLLQHDVALALLDVQMPNMDGYELAELMRGTERTRRIPIIFLTAGIADHQRRFRGYEAGAVDFLVKPIEPDILRSKTDVFFELYRQRQQIEAQRDELKESDKRKDEFLATLAHELRNPLAPIRSGLEVLRATPTGAKAEQIRDMMERQLSHLVRLIDDLLDVSRVSQGKIELRKERVELRTVVDVACEASSPLVAAGRHALTIESDAAPIWLEADPTRLSQVISNLLNNAAKYTPAGGRIWLRAYSDARAAVVSVSDNGVGISPEMLPRIFELFTQVETSLPQARGGLGIGLALVQRLVAMHGGAIEAASDGEGKGSTFTVRLPIAPELAVGPSPSPAPPAPASDRGLRVLVVDDNFDVAQTVGWMVETIGHDYRLVHEATQAVEAAREFRPDAVLLDIGMPGMDGYAVCKAFRADSLTKDAMIIAQTGWGQDRDRIMSAQAGFDHHLVKPVSLEDLERLLEGVSVSKRSSQAAGRSDHRSLSSSE
jgi:signal transduction histidine kinase